MKRPVTQVAASVRQRLLTLSRNEKRDFQEVLTRFALERLLYRLSTSEYRDQFVLKGALLFVLWSDELHRFTQDMDLLGYGSPSLERLIAVFQSICRTEVQEDGLIFEAPSVSAQIIREDNVYGGVRITLRALLGQARIPMQVDIGFGDAAVPDPEVADFPPLLDFPAPRLKVYRRETSIAEKFLAIVTLGQGNSRMKDYFDIWLLARDFAFEGDVLSAAIEATLVRRNVALPDDIPTGLTAAFAENRAKRIQWDAFVHQRVVTPEACPTLTGAVARIRELLLPLLQALQSNQPFEGHWEPGGPWQSATSAISLDFSEVSSER